jgi:hypothetical protein
LAPVSRRFEAQATHEGVEVIEDVLRNAASAEALRHPVASAPESGDVPWAMLERVAEARIAIDQTVLVLKAADDG